jgi:tetratricopeptide (TPR) repeat protein
MSKRARLLLVALAAGILIVGAYSWLRVQDARTQQQFDSALEGARRAAQAGPAGKGVCERVLPVLRDGVPALDRREAGSDRVKRAYRAMGECLMRVGRYQEAVEAFDRVVFYEPQQSRAHGDLALALSRAGRRQAALQHARLSVQLSPNVWQAHRILGQVLAAEGRTQEAIVAMERARSLAPAGEQASAQRAIDRLKARAGGGAADDGEDNGNE